MNNLNTVTNNTKATKFQEEDAIKKDPGVIPASPSKLIAGFKMLSAKPEELIKAPAPVREYIAVWKLLYGGGKYCGFSIEEVIPEGEKKFFSIFCNDYELMQKHFESREAAEAEAPKDGSFYKIYETASKVYFRCVSVTGAPVEEGVLYEDKMEAASALLAYLKPILTREVKAYAES